MLKTSASVYDIITVYDFIKIIGVLLCKLQFIELLKIQKKD